MSDFSSNHMRAKIQRGHNCHFGNWFLAREFLVINLMLLLFCRGYILGGLLSTVFGTPYRVMSPTVAAYHAITTRLKD